jgi:hypothetical protein
MDGNQLYKEYFPDELEKYQGEGRVESNLEKKFTKKLAKGSEFHFSDGKVAHNLLTWFQSIQLATPDIIAVHLRNHEFSVWLDEKVKAPELARICSAITTELQSGVLNSTQAKTALLSNITKSSLNNMIFDTIILPLLRKAKSNDISTADEAIDKLFMLGDNRIVEPLLDRIFDSQPQIRHRIITGLGNLGDKRVTPTLIKILKHSKDSEDRLLAVKTLGIIHDKRAVSALRSISRDDDVVGAEAKRILEQITK